MKYVVITTRLGARGQNQIQYPAIYNAEEVDRTTLGPLVYKGRHDEGDLTGEVLMCMKDAAADAYSEDDDVRIITEAEADVWLQTNPNLTSDPEEQVTDVERLQAIGVKIAAGIDLTAEDFDALNPDKPARGINRKSKNARSYFARG